MKRLLSFLLITVLLTACIAILPASAADKITYEKMEISAELFNEKYPVTFTCLFRSDLPEIPYISVDDYLNQLFTKEVTVTDNKDGTFSVDNSLEEMIIDVENDTLHLDFAEDFCTVNAKPYMDEEKAEYLSDESSSEELGEHHGADVDLSRYGIDITAVDGRVYLPYCTLNDVMSNNYRAAVYNNGELRFVETMDEENYSDQVGGGDTRSAAFAAFTYNELCLTMDYFYGRPSKAELAESIAEKGFDRALEDYNNVTRRAREYLQSESTKDFCIGLMLLDLYLSDGGHTNMSLGVQTMISRLGLSDIVSLLGNAITDINLTDLQNLLDSQGGNISDAVGTATLKAEKNAAYEKLDLINMWDCAELYRAGDTFIFSFDEFKDKVVEPYKWSLDYARDNGCKRFLIDLSTNNGGSVSVSTYMMSFMSDVYDPLEKYELTGNIFESHNIVDKNLDGKFDEKDDQETCDFRFAILTSATSFSCANLMPCTAQDNGVCIVGETSGGGCCNVAPHFYPGGGFYTISGSMKMIHENGEDFDSGAVPDVKLPGADVSYAGFYDIDRINEGVDEFYSRVITPEPKTEADTQDTGSATKADPHGEPMPGDYQNIVPYIIIGAAALIVIVIIVVVIVAVRRKKKRESSLTDTGADNRGNVG